MNVQDMINAVNRRVDDVIDNVTVVEYLNAGQNMMAVEVEALFVTLSVASLTYTPVYDAKYHEIPVLYACMRIKEMDSVLTEAANYRAQFDSQLKQFVLNYRVPPSLRDDRMTQQFTAVAGQTVFVVTRETYDPDSSDVTVYKNNREWIGWSKVISQITDSSTIVTTTTSTNDPNGIIINTGCTAGDLITITWDEHADVANPPYSWWAGQGW